MFNIKLTIEYNGTNYAGWQCQKSKTPNPKYKIKTIQKTIEKTLQVILQEKIKLIGSGRTDAGVHAKAQVANFKTIFRISLKNIQKALNSLLPEDIVVKDIKKVPLDFHSRFNAKSKLYRYVILNRNYPDPFFRNYVYFYPHPLNVNLMRQEARCLIGRHDFKSFQAKGESDRFSIRTIKNLKIIKRGDFIYIDIKADGFLYNMARNIVGTLIDIGRYRLKKGDLKRILLAKDRKFAGPTVPAKGLFLIEVNY